MTTVILPDWLVELAQKMNAQNNRSTQLPLFIVQELREVYKEEGQYQKRRDYDQYDAEDLCDTCIEEYEKRDGVYPDHCDECSPNCFVRYDLEWQFVHAGVFLTSAACDDHITATRYRYSTHGVRSYGISAYHSTEMALLLQWLSEIGTGTGEPVSHYRV